MSAGRTRLPLEEPDLVEDTEDLIRIDRSDRQVVVGIPPVVEMEPAEHLFAEEPRDHLLDVLRRVVVTGIDEHLRRGPAARESSSAMPQSAMSVW